MVAPGDSGDRARATDDPLEIDRPDFFARYVLRRRMGSNARLFRHCFGCGAGEHLAPEREHAWCSARRTFAVPAQCVLRRGGGDAGDRMALAAYLAAGHRACTRMDPAGAWACDLQSTDA